MTLVNGIVGLLDHGRYVRITPTAALAPNVGTILAFLHAPVPLASLSAGIAMAFVLDPKKRDKKRRARRPMRCYFSLHHRQTLSVTEQEVDRRLATLMHSIVGRS